MNEETEIGMQAFDSSFGTIELRFRQEPEMENTMKETSTDEPTLISVDERIKQATDPILRRVEELCALLASRTEMETAGKNEASGPRSNHESYCPLRNRQDKPDRNKKVVRVVQTYDF